MNLDPAEARRRFAAAGVARLATVSPGGRPHLVPVTFAVDGDVIYSAVDAKPKTTTRLARLRNIAAEPRVAMLADHYGPDWDRLWWVRADGAATVLAGAAGIPYGVASGSILGLVKGVQYGGQYGAEEPFSKKSIGLGEPCVIGQR